MTAGELFPGDALVAEAIGSATNVADTVAGNNPIKAGYKVMHGDVDVTANADPNASANADADAYAEQQHLGRHRLVGL